MQDFRLRKLEVENHYIFKDRISFEFFQPEDNLAAAKPYFTVIIGPNGTGKSHILRFIIEVFRAAYEKGAGLDVSHYPKGKYMLEYFLDGNLFAITNTADLIDSHYSYGEETVAFGKGIRLFRNNELVEFDLSFIPKAILAVSVMLNDKFPVFKGNDFNIYHYLGVKRDNSSAGTRSYISKAVDMIYRAANRKQFRDDAKALLEFLELDSSLIIRYNLRYKTHFFKGDVTEQFFDDFFTDYKKYLDRETEPWSVGVYRNIKDFEPEIIPRLVDLVNSIADNPSVMNEKRSRLYFDFDVFKDDTSYYDYINYLPYLHRLDIISYPQITLKKKGRQFAAHDSSSGEYHLISSMLGILGCIDKNAVVLIDEPEISLHPNWQMRYIHFLNEIFSTNPACHFLICTHSHFMVSDLKSENSTILSLKKDSRDSDTRMGEVVPTIKAEQLPYDTFGWSSEDVLYNIFNVRSSLNYYLEADLTELLGMISNNVKDTARIAEIIEKIDALPKRENDPLQEIIIEAKDYLSTIQ